MTIDQLKKHRDELLDKFGRHERIAFANVSETQLSIARHYGRTIVQGHVFIYNAEDDSLIRSDVIYWMNRMNRKKVDGKKAETQLKLL